MALSSFKESSKQQATRPHSQHDPPPLILTVGPPTSRSGSYGQAPIHTPPRSLSLYAPQYQHESDPTATNPDPFLSHTRARAMNQYPFSHPPPLGLARYGSAPGSLLASIAESVIDGGGGGFPASSAAAAGGGSEVAMGRFLSRESPCLTSESSCRATATATASPDLDPYGGGVVGPGLQRSYGMAEVSAGDLEAAGDSKVGGNPLVRHSSSPAGFFSHLLVDDGLPITRGIGHYSQSGTNFVHAMANRRLKSQLSFSRQDALSQISEISIPGMGESIDGDSSDETAGNVTPSYISSDFPIGSWDETSSIIFSGPPSKRAKDNNGDIATNLSCIDSQFSLANTSLEMATMEKFLQIQQDSVPFKVRAKRGCATHPRSIAERERRTRISEKLRKLQELVPNMDKQTSTSDMLELAVQHIKELQSKAQILKQERESCTCARKKEIS